MKATATKLLPKQFETETKKICLKISNYTCSNKAKANGNCNRNSIGIIQGLKPNSYADIATSFDIGLKSICCADIAVGFSQRDLNAIQDWL